MASWNTDSGSQNVISDNWSGIQRCIQAGLLPVMHGDVVLDSNPQHHTCILSGDELMVGAAQALPLSLSVFVSGVDGLYDRPPNAHWEPAPPSADPHIGAAAPPTVPSTASAPPARRIARAIACAGGDTVGSIVFADGLGAVAGPPQEAPLHTAAFESSTDAHDVTGGIASKIRCALQVANASAWRSSGVPVLLTGVHAATGALAGILCAAADASVADRENFSESLEKLEQISNGTLVLPAQIASSLSAYKRVPI